MSENNDSQLQAMVNLGGSCKGNLGPLGPLVPDRIIMRDGSGLLTFEAHTGNPATSGQIVMFELPTNIKSGSHDEFAFLFRIHVYGGADVESYLGRSGTINLVVNRVKQEFSANLIYMLRAPDQSEFEITMDLNISGFNQLIIPT